MGIFGNRKSAPEAVGDVVSNVVEDVTDTVNKFNTKEQATRRAEMDMLSDTRLSKNIRPLSLIWALSLLTIAMIVKAFGVQIDEQVLDTIYWVNIIVLSFYFPGRTIEKWADRRLRKK